MTAPSLLAGRRASYHTRRCVSRRGAGERKWQGPQNTVGFTPHICKGNHVEGCTRGLRDGDQDARWGGRSLLFFFNIPRTLSRPSWTPVSRAKTAASSRQLLWEYRE